VDLSLQRRLKPSAPVSGVSDLTASTEHDLRAMTRDGVFFCGMVGLGESYIPAFAIAIGLGDVATGLLATGPMLVGACLQLVTPLGVRMFGSYRTWVVWCARFQALSFIPLVVGAFVGRIDMLWLAFATVAYWTAGMSAGPAWNAWVTSLVPDRIRETFFARRTRAAHASLLVALVFGGLSLELGRRYDFELAVFGVLFVGALAARLISAEYLASQSERPGLLSEHRSLGPAATWLRLREAGSLRVLQYLLVMQVVTNIAAPYFTPYMLNRLELSYGEFMGLIAASFLARVAILPRLGRIARDESARRLLWLGGLGIVPLPILWLVSDSFVYLLFIQLVAGCAWAAIELATTLSFFEGIAEADRASVLSVFNLANALATVAGALVGAALLTHFETSSHLYAWLFAASTLGRLLAASLLSRTPTATRVDPAFQMRTLAVRPSGVAVQRPILASIGSQASESPVPHGHDEEV
jgi:hypothetical protein